MTRHTQPWAARASQRLGAGASLAAALLAWPVAAWAVSSSAAPSVELPPAAAASTSTATARPSSAALHHLPASRDERASLQNGARHYLQSCLACHSAKYVSYGQLQDLGITLADVQVLLPDDPPQSGAAAITSPLPAEQAVQWFGAAPPDLSLATRTQGNWRYSGADHVYSYLRGFYRDPSTRSGWNNTVVPNTAMPHVLAALQGSDASAAAAQAEAASPPASSPAEQGTGQLSAAEYEQALADITHFMQWMAEPDRQTRKRWGWFVCALFAAFAFAAWRLHASYWKDVQ